MKTKATIHKILTLLDEHYPDDGVCFLHHDNAWQLLFATILSAQCTDERVNIVTKDLFKHFPTLESYAQADILDIEAVVKSTGFYHAKAKHLQESARKLLTDFHGAVPRSVEDLTSLSGVGRKTANVVRSHIFNVPSVTVDTHVGRISHRLGITSTTEPVKAEQELMKALPKKHWIRYNQQIITHGRLVCTSRKAKCSACFLTKCCDYYKAQPT